MVDDYTIIKSVERRNIYHIEPWKMHNTMVLAKLLISDSQTMTIEAAALSVPSVRINTFIGKSSVIDELENKFKLSFGFYPHAEIDILKIIYDIINNENILKIWSDKRQSFLNTKFEYNHWVINNFLINF